MQLILIVLLTLLLAACATPDSTSPNDIAARVSHSGVTDNSDNKNYSFPDDTDLVWLKGDEAQTVNIDKQSVDSLANRQGDLWVRIRAGFGIPDLDSPLVQTQLNWYRRHPEYVQRMTERSQKYLYYIVQSLEQRHMPTELALLPFIESAYNPQALSRAKAAGMWQFVPATGRLFKLKQNMFQDERRDVLASTDAALDYLAKLHTMFGDWQLALAAYNWGDGSVERAIARNRARGLPTDYLSLRLPAETRNYVPKLQAIKDIVANPQLYGLALTSVPNRPYFVSIKTSHDLDVDIAARLAELPLSEFKALNPSLKKPVIVSSIDAPILLPFDNARIFEKNLHAYTGRLSTWTTYRVRRRATPAVLARRIGVNAKTLVAINKIPSGMRLKPGSTLLVPSTHGHSGDISAAVAEHAVLAVEPNVRPVRYVLVRLRRHETIARLAQHYGVTTAQIRIWNKERRIAYRPGQLVMLHLPVKTSRLYLAQAERPRDSRARRDRRSVEQLAMLAPRARYRPQLQHSRVTRVAHRVSPQRLASKHWANKIYASNKRTLRYSSRDRRLVASTHSERVANAEKIRKQQEG